MIHFFLTDRQQGIVLNGQSSNFNNAWAIVLQGAVRLG